MLPLPLFHVYANVGVQPLAFVGPNPLSLVPNPRDIDDLLKTISQVKPAFFNGVPTLYTAILNHPDVRAGKVDLTSIKLCFCGASALMAETRRQFEAKTGARIIEGYSLTEGMMACCVNPVNGTNKVGSIGMPLPDVEVRIVDSDTGVHDMPSGEVGELIVRAPQHMAEYWNNPVETAEALRAHRDGTTMVAHGRPRLPRHRRLRVSGGPQEDSSRPAGSRSGLVRSRRSSRRIPPCSKWAWLECRTRSRARSQKPGWS